MNKKVLHFRKSARGAVLRWGGLEVNKINPMRGLACSCAMH